MAEGMTLVEAVRTALTRAMLDDPHVVVLGEDVGVNGGVFRATDGLLARFGPDRVLDLPISESMFVGMAVGLSARGFRPVVEYQFSDFMYPAFEQLACHAARMRHRTQGRLTCPLVVRAPYGGGIHAPELHSESFEALLAHMPGLRLVIPSSPAGAYGLLLAAIRDPDPVVFLEPKRIYRSVRDPVADDGVALALDRCSIVRPGRDLTIVSWGASLTEATAAASVLANDVVEAEVIDVVTLRPLDMETILESVGRTGRCVIVHEAPRAAGFGAEIAAGLADEGLTSLLAPVTRVTGYDTVTPLSALEHSYLPSTERVLCGARRVLEYT